MYDLMFWSFVAGFILGWIVGRIALRLDYIEGRRKLPKSLTILRKKEKEEEEL